MGSTHNNWILWQYTWNTSEYGFKHEKKTILVDIFDDDLALIMFLSVHTRYKSSGHTSGYISMSETPMEQSMSKPPIISITTHNKDPVFNIALNDERHGKSVASSLHLNTREEEKPSQKKISGKPENTMRNEAESQQKQQTAKR